MKKLNLENLKLYIERAKVLYSRIYTFLYNNAKPIHYSVFLHLFVLFFSLSVVLREPKFTPQQTIVVDLVQVAKNTNIEKKTKKSVKNSKIQTKASVKKKVVAEPKKTVKKAKEETKKAKKNPPKSKKSIEKVAEKKQVSKPVSKPKAASIKKKTDNKKSGEAILKSVEKNKVTKKDAKDSKNIVTNKEANQSKVMTLDEVQSLRSQIMRNWNASAWSGANLKLMEVIMRIKLDKQGNVLAISQVSSNLANNNFTVFKESVENAIRKSSPLNNLPEDKYTQWQEIEFTFSSRDMVY